MPIISGGTGLYVDSLINNISFAEEDVNESLREELNAKIENIGADRMLDELSEFDPETAKRLHPSNKKRIVRAFEVYLTTGKTFSQTLAESTKNASRFDPIYIGINYKNRDELYNRINMRVDLMLEEGLVEEAKRYYALSSKNTASQAIGYKELKPYFDGEISLEEAIEHLKLSTRHYAKRQLTWFRRNLSIQWFYPDEYENRGEFNRTVKEYIQGRLK